LDAFRSDELAAARDLGRLEAESYDRELREREEREREERLARLSLGAEGARDAGAPLPLPSDSSSTFWRLQQENQRLIEFHRAVVKSRAWRLVQALRRPFGRAW
jgi:hypothetical protein